MKGYNLDYCKKLIVGVILLSCVTFSLGCNTVSQKKEKKIPFVLLAQHDKAGRCLILVKDLKLRASIVPRGALPYSENASAALWIGVNFNYKKALKVITTCRNYYPNIKYIALSDLSYKGQTRGKYELYLGASTERAICLGLKPWSVKNKKRLLKVKSRSQFNKLVRSNYGAQKNCLNRIEESPWYDFF